VIASDSGRKPLDTEKLLVRPPLPHEWKSRALNEVCTFSNGLWKGEKPPFIKVGVIRNTNFTTDGHLDDSDIAYLDVEAKKLDKRRLQHGDIILEKSGGGPKQPVGRVALFDKTEGDFSFSNFTAALRVIDPTELDFRFLHKFLYWMYVSGVTEGMQTNSTGIRNLDGDAYKAIRISFPALPEQRRIIGILDEAFGCISAAKSTSVLALRNARALFEGALQRTFAEAWTYDLVTLQEIAAEITDGDHMPPPKSKTGVPFVTIGNIDKKSRRVDFSGTFMVSEAYYQRLKSAKKPQRGDVLYTVTGSFGIPVLIDHDRAFCFQRHIGLIRPAPSTDSAWLAYLLLSPQVFSQANEQATGTAQRTVSLRVLRSLTVPRLPLVEQRRAVGWLGAVAHRSENLATINEQKLARLDELKKSLLHQAFSGQL
jgi:type I restriction enzyme S subunit